MTGIEQLRKLGADAVRGGEVGRAICDIADQIERERECERDTIENLRLELGEARDEAAWVREHGGLDGVKDLIETNVWAHSLAIIAHDALFGEDDDREVTPTEFKYELGRRLMPEGMELEGNVLRIRTAENVDYDGETLFVLIGGGDE